MTSREEMAMDPNSVTFTRNSGVFVTRRCGLLLLLLFTGALLVTGLLVGYFHGPACDPGAAAGKAGDAVGTDGSSKSTKPRDVRLPRHLAPEAYKIRLLPFIEEGNFTFSGEVTATLRADAPGSNITLHINDMLVHNDSVTVTDATARKAVKIAGYRYDEDREFFVVMLERPLELGHKYEVFVRFVGNLNDKLAGFYRSSYKTPQGETRWMAVTQFAPTDARKAFPCLDEPALKATFEITLGRPKRMTSISNMPIRVTEQNELMADYEWDVYEKSVPMSTYLVAFAVTDLAVKEADPGLSDTLFRVWARPAAIAQADYARAIGPAILEYYEDFFKTEFPLPKQDMAALPDLAAGAMENWGLITYKETALLYDPEVSSEANKQRVAVVVAHELAHMWFGDLVTPSWWTDVWLNEGFASYVEILGTHKVEPTWRMLDQMVTRVMHRVMTTDALESSHPISILVQHTDEIGQVFDSISYKKGASIIRMMDHMLTRDTLRDALSNYLKAMKYQAAEQDDLWRFLTEQAHRDGTLSPELSVKQVMDTWTLQMGFPVVEVRRDYAKKSAQLTQSRFLLNDANNSSTEFLWWVPLVYTTQARADFNNTKPTQWMKQERQITINDLAGADEWVILNVQEVGYFKVNYDEKNWGLLVDQLQRDHSVIHTINRAQLIDDALDLGRAGHLGYETALSVLSYLEREHDFLPWDAALANLDFFDKQLMRSTGYGAFQRFMLKLIEPLYEMVGFDERPSDSHIDHDTRDSAIAWACRMGHPDCLSKSVNQFNQWMDDPDNPSIIPANIRSRVFCTALSQGGLEEWEFAWGRYNASNVASEKQRLLRALACTKKIWLLTRLLSWLVTPGSGIRVQDGPLVFQAVSSNSLGRYLAWDFLRDNFPKIVETYANALFALPRFIATLNDGYNTRLDLEQLQLFAKKHEANLSEAKREIQQALEHSTANVAWMDKNYDTVVRWLEKQNKGN